MSSSLLLSWLHALCAGILRAAMTGSYLGWPQGCHRAAETSDSCSASGRGSDVRTFRGQSSSFLASEIDNQGEP